MTRKDDVYHHIGLEDRCSGIFANDIFGLGHRQWSEYVCQHLANGWTWENTPLAAGRKQGSALRSMNDESRITHPHKLRRDYVVGVSTCCCSSLYLISHIPLALRGGCE